MRKETSLRRKDLIHPKLCYKIVGVLFDVHNELGHGYREKYYQKAVASGLDNNGISYKEQVCANVSYKDKIIGKVFLDFLVEDKVILEIKKADRFSKTEIDQVHGYLKATGLKLGVIAHFAKDGVKYKRILNL